MVFVHAREAEEKFIAEEFGVKRNSVMYNDFVIIGPKNNPAGIKGSRNATFALRAIKAKGAPFISRGDRYDSACRLAARATHRKTKSSWLLGNLRVMLESRPVKALGWASLSAMISLLNNTSGLSKAYDSRGFRAKSKCVSEKLNESLHPRSRR